MKIAYCSDLHLEINLDLPKDWPPADVLILAGDILSAAMLDSMRTDPESRKVRDYGRQLIDDVFPRYQKVFMVMGNHEHYHGVFDQTADRIEDFFVNAPNFHLLNNKDIMHNGVLFLGSTLWTDFNKGDGLSMFYAQRGMNDFYCIKSRPQTTEEAMRGIRVPNFTPEMALLEHHRSLEWMDARIKEYNKFPSVVITHHAPTLKSLNYRHVGNGLDPSFASDLQLFIEEHPTVKMWFHGHTHHEFDYECFLTRVLANQRGYHWEDQYLGFQVKTVNLDVPNANA